MFCLSFLSALFKLISLFQSVFRPFKTSNFFLALLTSLFHHELVLLVLLGGTPYPLVIGQDKVRLLFIWLYNSFTSLSITSVVQTSGLVQSLDWSDMRCLKVSQSPFLKDQAFSLMMLCGFIALNLIKLWSEWTSSVTSHLFNLDTSPTVTAVRSICVPPLVAHAPTKVGFEELFRSFKLNSFRMSSMISPRLSVTGENHSVECEFESVHRINSLLVSLTCFNNSISFFGNMLSVSVSMLLRFFSF